MAEFREERAELEAVLASGIFSRSPSLATFLQFICQRHFEGAGEHLKESSIAVEAFGRSTDFDQKKDSIVRVEAHRLRKRLQEYYDGPGAEHSVRITIPPGQYAPQFIKRHNPRPAARPSRKRYVAAVAAVVLVAATALLIRRLPTPVAAVEPSTPYSVGEEV
jgi:hypothetical protein